MMAALPMERRLRALNAHIGERTSDPSAATGIDPVNAAGILARIRSLWGGGDDDVAEGEGAEEEEASPAPTGVVAACYVADEEWPGHEVQADPRFSEHYIRQHVDSIQVEATPSMEVVPPSHREMAVGLRDPNERALMMSTAEGYAKLREALPHAAATLSHERPGSGENFYVDGLEQNALCLGDVFAVEGRSTSLEVASPRRPCEKWNKVHNMAAHPHGEVEGNVRQFCLTNTLGGVYFRIASPGEICVGDSLTLVKRPHPDWPLSRVGSLLYGNASVLPEGGLRETKGEAWSGTNAELMELIQLPELAWYEWKACLTEKARADGLIPLHPGEGLADDPF